MCPVKVIDAAYCKGLLLMSGAHVRRGGWAMWKWLAGCLLVFCSQNQRIFVKRQLMLIEFGHTSAHFAPTNTDTKSLCGSVGALAPPRPIWATVSLFDTSRVNRVHLPSFTLTCNAHATACKSCSVSTILFPWLGQSWRWLQRIPHHSVS